jgi:hypothetical protein
MTKQNKVLDLGSYKEKRELRRCLDSFASYLKGLSNGQLEVEVNFLLDEFSKDDYAIDFFSRSQLLLKEISSRAHPMVKRKIELLQP